ncbi:MAG TPA: T9SS type A sorting domain-containing protein [Lentimicrobium sp.]|nr:T9SS type A sorting domain-containing protein [Lentimicrobium sp.]
MKTRLLITAILTFGFYSFSFAQNTWAPIGAIWHYDYHGGWGEYISYITIEATKDTVIQGIQCTKLEQRGPGSNPDQWTSDNYFTYESNDTVWFFDGTSFRMLYDFGATVNESWEAYGPSLWNICEDSLTTVMVDSIGYETINGFSLRYLKASTPESSWGFNNCSDWEENHKILEKIGSFEFLLPQMICGADFPGICNLRCYEDSEIGFFSTGIADSCTYERGVGIPEIGFDNNIKIFPNPVTEELTIEFPESSSTINNCSIQIRNVDGIVIKELQLKQNTKNIIFSDLKPGVYLIIFTYNNISSISKMVKL